MVEGGGKIICCKLIHGGIWTSSICGSRVKPGMTTRECTKPATVIPGLTRDPQIDGISTIFT